MHQPAKVLAVYRELRQSMGANIAATALMSCAASLVELFTIDETEPRFELTERDPPEYRAVDRVLANGWWGLSREWRWLGLNDADANWEHFPTWRHGLESTWEARI